MREKIIVTGGSRGIGRATVLELAEKGYDIAFLYHKETEKANLVAEQARSMGASCHCFARDLSQGEQAKDGVEACISALGGLDGVVCNAGVAEFGLLTDLSFAQWHHVIDSNLSSLFYVVQSALPVLVSQKKGQIVTVSSMWGQVGASCEVAYSTAKAGVIGFTKALAKEVAPSNIMVNCVAPGVIDTDMIEMLSQEDRTCLKEEIPLGRIGTGEEVARVIGFLLASHGTYLTGQVLSPNGGIVM